MREATQRDGQWLSLVLMSILDHEYRARISLSDSSSRSAICASGWPRRAAAATRRETAARGAGLTASRRLRCSTCRMMVCKLTSVCKGN